MNKYSVLVRCVIYSVIGLFLAFPVQAIVFSYTDRDIQVLQLQTKKLELEIQLLKAKPLRLGAFENAVDRVASGTAISAFGTYFHGAVETRTATSVVLTVGGLSQADKIGVRVIVKNATNTPGTIFLYPEVSSDDQVWGAVSLHAIDTTGAAVTNIAMGNGSSTLITYTPNSQGTTSQLQTFYAPVIGSGSGGYLRFSMWTTGTSSNMVEVYKMIK